MWFLIGEERVTCRWLHRAAKPTISQGKQQLELSNRTWSGPVFWNPGKCVCQPASSEQFFWPFFVVVLYFWVRRYNKTLSDWHCEILRVLLYLPTQIGERRVRCRWSKLANSLGRTKLTNALGDLNFRLALHQVGLLETAANSCVSRPQANNFYSVFSIFELSLNKTLNDSLRGKQWAKSGHAVELY